MIGFQGRVPKSVLAKHYTGKRDIPDKLDKFKKRDSEKFEDRKAKCFFVLIEEIMKNDYDLSILSYKEVENEEIDYEEPEVIRQKNRHLKTISSKAYRKSQKSKTGLFSSPNL